MGLHYNSYGFLNIDNIEPSPLRLYDFGVEIRSNENYYFDNSNRGSYKGYLFQYTLDGTGIFETQNKSISLSKGQAFFISFPNKSKYYLNKNTSWKFFYIHFNGSLAKDFFKHINLLHGNTLNLNNDSSCIRLFFDEFNAVSKGKQYKRYESGEFIYKFLTSLIRDLETPTLHNTSELVENTVQWINSNYSTNMSLSAMSNELGISLPHLTRQFHKQKGLSPMKYLTNVRLEHSIALLLNTSLTINEIALACGFSNGNYYTKVFKKVTSMTPSEYRNLHC